MEPSEEETPATVATIGDGKWREIMRISFWFPILFAAIMVPIMAQENSERAKKNALNSVTLRGQVTSIELRDVTSTSVSVVIKLKLEARNSGTKPVIFLESEPPKITGATLTKSPSDPSSEALVNDYRGPSVDRSAKWSTLRNNLDRPSPPRDKIRVLMPDQSWSFEGTVDITLPTEASNHSYFPKSASFETVQKYSPVWMKLNWEVWPLNVEPWSNDRSKLKFGRMLQRRWKDVGVLWLDGIYSEPIMLDLKGSGR